MNPRDTGTIGYVLERRCALRDNELVVVLSVRKRGVRSRIVLADGSSVDTLTRPRAFIRKTTQRFTTRQGLVWPNA